ncbi:hypothetical protein SUNI508_07799 [Seiridium unicorne]|uniref:DUF7729 domain-containing protein n=1 Tax=Seiridium unicorne TaxID=138068 RepID=A0ABR2UW33_9PEZI
MIFALILCLVSTTTAFSLVTPPHPFETLIVDTRVPVLLEDNWVMMSREEHERFLHKRADADSYPTSSEDLTTTTVPIQVSTGTAKATTTTTKAATTTASASALPSPFDNAIAANFTGNGNCQEFITDLLKNSTFQQCYPFSMLVQGSYSMFNAEKSLVSITQVLDATCAANVTFCTDYLGGVADKLIDSDNCEDDYQEENSVVVQVYQGLKSYQPLYSASCLQDAETSAYCFANAITNSSAIADTYLYYLPLNISYPNSTTPDCNQCTQNVMGIFQAATADRDSGIAYTYAEAAETVNAHCGASYVNATLPEAVASFAVPTQSAPSLLFLSFLVMALSQWLL